MKIRLSDIPREGSFWHFTRGQEEDLDLALQDLLGEKEAYSVELRITPLDQSGTYHIDGRICTQWQELCSKCADEFEFKINQPFHDLLIPKLKMPRNGSTSKPQHLEHTCSSTDSDAYEYEAEHFNIGEFLHEILALARPLAPKPEEDASGNCSLCHKSHDQIMALLRLNREDPTVIKRSSPFEVLKNLKN
jgi:uncharacterized protein